MDHDQSAPSWHTLSAQQLEQQLQTGSAGLTAKEAADRLSKHGPNELQATKHVSAWAILLSQFQNVLLIILLIATALSAALGHGLEAAVIAVIVLFAVVLGFVQEFRAERAMEALREMAAPTASVVRDGREAEIAARDLVPGDVILLEAGDKVPADGRLLEIHNLKIEEAALTGESVPSEKTAGPLDAADLPLGDRTNMAYAGTAATYGRGRAIVVATGMHTEFGKIAAMLHTVESMRTPLQENLDKLGGTLARVALVIVACIVALGLFRAEDWNAATIIELLVFGIALAVAVVPEALPAVVTISLAIGVQRMVKRHALIRRLPAVETLGSTSIICSDKTGTLTKDEMTVRQIFAAGQFYEVTGAGYEPRGEFKIDGKAAELSPTANELLRAAALCSDAQITHQQADERWKAHGDPTEAALVAAAAKAGLKKDDLDREFPRQGEKPFSSETKRMTTLHTGASGPVAYSKGAAETLLEASAHAADADGESPLNDECRQRFLRAERQMAEHALRVLAVAKKQTTALDDADGGMTLLGLLGMIDPPRSEAIAAIRQCEAAGIKVVMITGDHPLTARAVAGELGLLKANRVVTGKELDALSDEALADDVEQIDVYARVSPAHKLRVVTAVQKRGHVVAMTGDGVNDAPALKKADIGIAMGITGTDVSKEAAAMILTDDNFASIVAAVEEGRGIVGNIKKYLMFLLSSNIGEIGLMTGTSLLGLPLPLTAVQILYVNLATDGLPALALAVDPPEDDLMQRPPRNPRTGIFTPRTVRLMLIGGAWSSFANLSLFWAALVYYRSAYSPETAQARAMAVTFISLVLIQFFKAYSFRSDHLSVLHRPLANRWLNLAIAWELLLLALIVYVPFLQIPFGMQPLHFWEWLLIIFWAHTILPVLEFAKFLERKHLFGRSE
jgi:Ca2+-transporting ATPase